LQLVAKLHSVSPWAKSPPTPLFQRGERVSSLLLKIDANRVTYWALIFRRLNFPEIPPASGLLALPGALVYTTVVRKAFSSGVGFGT